MSGQAGEAGGQALQSSRSGESHAPGLESGEKTRVLCVGCQGINLFQLIHVYNWIKSINMCLQVVLGLRGSNKIIEDQLDEVLIRNGVENPSKIQLVETEIKE